MNRELFIAGSTRPHPTIGAWGAGKSTDKVWGWGRWGGGGHIVMGILIVYPRSNNYVNIEVYLSLTAAMRLSLSLYGKETTKHDTCNRGSIFVKLQ